MAFKGSGDTLFEADGFSGPGALAYGEMSEEDRELIASIILKYGKVKENESHSVSYQNGASSGTLIARSPIADSVLDEMRI